VLQVEETRLARKRPSPRRKIRTREHVIAELGVNHVERQALLCGFSVERIVHDYGIDLMLFTYNADGEIENGVIFLQVKASERIKPLAKGGGISFPVLRTDLLYWLSEVYPVILIVYDVSADRACWVDVQGYFASQQSFNLFRVGRTVRVHVSLNQVLDSEAVRHFAALRDRVL
jgi:hypothetical protein